MAHMPDLAHQIIGSSLQSGGFGRLAVGTLHFCLKSTKFIHVSASAPGGRSMTGIYGFGLEFQVLNRKQSPENILQNSGS